MTQTARRHAAYDWQRDEQDARNTDETESRANALALATRKAEENAAYEELDWWHYRNSADWHDDSYEECEPSDVGSPDWCWRLKPHLDRIG